MELDEEDAGYGREDNSSLGFHESTTAWAEPFILADEAFWVAERGEGREEGASGRDSDVHETLGAGMGEGAGETLSQSPLFSAESDCDGIYMREDELRRHSWRVREYVLC